VAYRRGRDGVHRAFGVAVLTVTATAIARIAVFGEASLVTRFGRPPVWATPGRRPGHG
jgi:RNA polymerase sigma-70 factor (ECF subfamily)